MTTFTSVAYAPQRPGGGNRRRCRLVCVAAAALVCVGRSRAQSTPATTEAATPPLRVAVLDPSGAKIPRAKVVVFQARTANDAAVLTLQTDRSGELQLNLPAGTYVLRVTARGFLDGQQQVEIGRGASQQVFVRLKIATKDETVDVPSVDGDGEASSGGQGLVLRGGQIAALSSNPATLQQQINALVQTDDGSAPELRVDGFSNGRLPPKSSIREIRVNQNAYSAQFDQRSNAVVDIFTQPGGDKLHGTVYLSGNADPMNAPNPFLPTHPSYHSTFLDAEANGPLGKHTSFFAGGTINDLQNSAAVNASIVDANFRVVPFSQTVPNPLLVQTGSLRIDHAFGEHNSFTGRAEWSGTHQDNDGIGTGQLVLPTAAYLSDVKSFALQLGNTTLVSAKTVVESRFQYRRTRTMQTPNSTAPSLLVEGGFTGGGSATQGLRDAQDSYEWQEYASWDRGRHFVRAGVRYRLTRDSNTSTTNFNGQYTFASLSAYQVTLQGLAAGQTPAEIRAAGGGASQYSITAGSPAAVITTGDLGAYIEDEWKVLPNFSVTGGLRYESQFGIPDHNDPAPRLGFAWTIGRKGKAPIVRLRGGVGFFYDRFAATNILTAARQNGILQQTFILNNPDTYPATPPPAAFGTAASTVYQIAPGLHSPYVLSEGFTAERGVWHGSASAGVTHEHGTHQLLSRNANAPLNGVRPLGGTQNLYQFASLGTSDTTTVTAGYTARIGRESLIWANYALRFRQTDAMGATSFVSNSYEVAADYGRTPSVARHRLFVGASTDLPFGFAGSMFLSFHSATRFNVVTGADNNDDSIFNDRPAFATDLSRPSVVQTAFGNFDVAPIAGQRIIPIDLGIGPGLVTVQSVFAREFSFGPAASAEAAPAGRKAGPPDRPFHVVTGVEVQNLFNHVNRSAPIGQLSSIYFGRSLSLDSEQSGSTAANRIVSAFLQVRF